MACTIAASAPRDGELLCAGNALYGSRELSAAAASYEATLRAAPRLAMAHANLGNVRSELGQAIARTIG